MSKLYELNADTVILSTSDLQGNIVSYNHGFKEASGYADAELMGKSHSLLRHADMPKEAFQDLWQTLNAKRAWHGMVKNQRKNGDFYWVSANVAPIITQGQVTGYVSVRYPIGLEQISRFERLYADIRAGRAKMPWTKVANDKRQLLIMTGLLAIAPVALFVSSMNSASIGLTIASLVGALSAGYVLRTLMIAQHPTTTQLADIERLTQGDFREPVRGNDEWCFTLNMIRARSAEFTAKQYDLLRETTMLTSALETASTCLMVVDSGFNIISVNASLNDLFQRHRVALKNALPSFDPDRMIGANMDSFHHHPAHQRALLQQLDQPHTSTIRVANLILILTVVPITRHGKRLGFVVEWFDKTMELGIVEDIERVVGCMRRGNFNVRVTAQAHGNLEEIKVSINEALSNLSEIIRLMTDVVSAQALGDFSQQLTSNVFQGQLHDLKNAINYASQRVKESVIHAVEASNIVTDASGQVSQGAIDLSGRVQQQAAALEQTSATMNQIALAVQTNTDNAHRVAKLAHEVQHQTESGVEVMKQTISAMQSITESSNKIADIVSIIDGIAFQTNLLALNAAVEAARAGDQGRGFAVVAGEVRALAQKSAEAAKDIKALISDSVNRIEIGTQLADKSGEMLTGITASIESVAQMIEHIATASHQQSQGIHQVHKAISEIDRVTQENAALVEETSSAADSLKFEAQDLRTTMAFFNTGNQTPFSPK